MRVSVLFLAVFLVGSFFASTALAQTSMQRRAQQEAEERGETTGQESQPTESSTTRQTGSTEPEVIQGRQGQRSGQRQQGQQEQVFNFYRAHKPGLRLDVGISDPTIWGIGLGYMMVMGWEIRALNQHVGVLRGGLGPDIGFQVSERGFEGVTGFATGRIHAVANAYGIGVEAGLGTGISGRGLSPASRLGVYFSGRYFEVGYFYQHTFFQRPQQMAAHNIGLRFHIPLMQF